MTETKIAILASGNGSNAENIANYFKGNPNIKVAVILSNRTDAYVLERAKKLDIPSYTFKNSELLEGGVLEILKSHKIDYVILAGFLLKVPRSLIESFSERIINLHPALLPKFGGKGMYGHHVHNAVIANQEIESGITIHLVNEIYDDGKILRQEKCPVNGDDDADSVASKVHELEYKYFPVTIENYILQKEV
ncbi:MAG: phosphoribosylglycinamide formyltransferase [bacterium]|nr:phosphoribosylglycinamide formyltransferase [bacterium]